jgi:hypothetical protein
MREFGGRGFSPCESRAFSAYLAAAGRRGGRMAEATSCCRLPIADSPLSTAFPGALGLPAQNGFAGGGNFVEAADSRGMRGGLDDFGIRFGFGGN